MHQSPRKEFGGFRREKYAAFELLDEDRAERRLMRGLQPKARKYQREDDSRQERARQHPRG